MACRCGHAGCMPTQPRRWAELARGSHLRHQLRRGRRAGHHALQVAACRDRHAVGQRAVGPPQLHILCSDGFDMLLCLIRGASTSLPMPHQAVPCNVLPHWCPPCHPHGLGLPGPGPSVPAPRLPPAPRPPVWLPQSRYSPLASSRCSAFRASKSSRNEAAAWKGRTSAHGGGWGRHSFEHGLQGWLIPSLYVACALLARHVHVAAAPLAHPPSCGSPRLLPMVARDRAASAIQQRRSTCRSSSVKRSQGWVEARGPGVGQGSNSHEDMPLYNCILRGQGACAAVPPLGSPARAALPPPPTHPRGARRGGRRPALR